MPTRDWYRIPALIVCLCGLGTLLILGGTDVSSLHSPPYPDAVDDDTRGLSVEIGEIQIELDTTERPEPWAHTYVLAMSLFGAFIVLVRGIDGWRFDTDSFTFEPREQPLHKQLTDG